MRGLVVLLALCLPLGALSVGAQAPVGELYFDAAGGTQGQSSASYKVRTADELPAAGKAYFPISSMGGTYTTTFSFAVPYDFAAGVVDFHFRIGCDTVGVAAPPAAASPMRIEVRDGSTLLKTVIPTVATTCNQQQLPVTGSIDLGGHTFKAGGAMNIGILAWFSNPYASGAGMYYVTGPEAALSGIGLPTGLLPAAPAVPMASTVYHLADNATLEFANATSETHVFNFTAAPDDVATFAWNATAGAVNVTLSDGNATPVFAQRLEGNGTLDVPAMPGNWSLALGFDGFVGSLSFGLHALETDAGPLDPATDGNETLQDNEPASQESPVPLLVPLALAGAALVRRRR